MEEGEEEGGGAGDMTWGKRRGKLYLANLVETRTSCYHTHILQQLYTPVLNHYTTSPPSFQTPSTTIPSTLTSITAYFVKAHLGSSTFRGYQPVYVCSLPLLRQLLQNIILKNKETLYLICIPKVIQSQIRPLKFSILEAAFTCELNFILNPYALN